MTSGFIKLVSKVMDLGGLGAGLALLFSLMFLIGLGWLAKHWLGVRSKLKYGKLEIEKEKATEDAKLRRDKFEADKAHVQKLEDEGAEWRTFFGNHMAHFTSDMKDITVALKAISDSHSRFAAKQIEGVKITHEKFDAHAENVEKDHGNFGTKLDTIGNAFSYLKGRLEKS